jgi:DeoR/GlpR family transcriptional regulator of sugar metabolism
VTICYVLLYLVVLVVGKKLIFWELSMPPLAAERRRRLLDLLTARGAINVTEVEKELGVSRMTIHRDLDILASEGLVRKVHGGAVALPKTGANANIRPFAERRTQAQRAKQAVAHHVLELLADAKSVAVDASTTTFSLAEAWAERGATAELFVATNGLELFEELRKRTRLHVALIGGEPHPRTGSLVGPAALAGAAALRFDAAVVSALGVLPTEGLVLDAAPEETAVKCVLLASARQKILAVDSSKLGVSAPYPLCPLRDFDWVVTEHGSQRACDVPKTKDSGR